MGEGQCTSSCLPEKLGEMYDIYCEDRKSDGETKQISTYVTGNICVCDLL